MLPKLSHLIRSLIILTIVLVIFILTVVIVRTPPKFFIYLWQNTKYVFVDALFPPTPPPTPTPIPTPITTFLPSQNPGKKIFRNVSAGFEIEVPEEWSDRAGRLSDANDGYYTFNYRFESVNQYDPSSGQDVRFSDPLSWEEFHLSHMRDCDSCVKIKDYSKISRNGYSGIRYVTRNAARSVDQRSLGYTQHNITELFIFGNYAYRFFAWQAENPKPELLYQYPQTHPTPLDYFDQIMSTLKFL